MKNYEKLLINGLLDAYENSRSIKNRGIYLRLTKKGFPEYFDQRSSSYDEIHKVAQNLEYVGILRCYWRGNVVGHVLEKVGLLIDDVACIEKAYEIVGRKSVLGKMENYFVYMENCPYMDNIVVKRLNDFISNRLELGLSVKQYLDFDNFKEFEMVLNGVYTVLGNKKEVFVRELSMILYGDSKTLENLRGRIEGIIRNFYSEDGAGELYNTEDIFSAFNVFKNPSTVFVKGLAKIEIGRSTVELSRFSKGIGLWGDDLCNTYFQPSRTIERIITVENLTAFHRFDDCKSIIIYLGGFHSSARRELIIRAKQAYPKAELLHWGDIDIGGFRIFCDLCLKTGLEFKPYRMGVEILKKYIKYGKPLTDRDLKGINDLKSYILKDYNDQKKWTSILETLDLMLDCRVKLEQEIVAYLEKTT